MFSKIMQSIPAPTWVGFVLSLAAIFIGWILSIGTFIAFLILVCVAWILLCLSEYELPLTNHAAIVFCMLLGYIPVLLVKFLFF